MDILSRDERIALVEQGSPDISLSRQAMLLGLNRSGLYYKPAPVSEEEVALKHRIDEIYTDYPFFGSRRITVLLRSEGLTVNRKTVVRHMNEMGIEAIYPKPNLSKRDLKHRIYPYLLSGVSIEKPNQVWGIDITYIRLQKGWMYLVAIIDWFSRFIVNWEVKQQIEGGGMRWSKSGADTMLSLRSILLNGNLSEYFNHHIRSAHIVIQKKFVRKT